MTRSNPQSLLPAHYSFVHKDGQNFPVLTKIKFVCTPDYWSSFQPILATVPATARDHLAGNTCLVTFVSAAETVTPFLVKPELGHFEGRKKGDDLNFYVKVQLKAHHVNSEVSKQIVPSTTFATKVCQVKKPKEKSSFTVDRKSSTFFLATECVSWSADSSVVFGDSDGK